MACLNPFYVQQGAQKLFSFFVIRFLVLWRGLLVCRTFSGLRRQKRWVTCLCCVRSSLNTSALACSGRLNMITSKRCNMVDKKAY